MAVIKFKSMDDGERIEHSNHETSGLVAQSADTKEIYRSFYEGDSDNKMDKAHKRFLINLAEPVLNPVLAGNSGQYLQELLGISDDDMKNICTFDMMFEPEDMEDPCEGELITVASRSDEPHKKYLFGYDLINQVYIENFYPKERLAELLSDHLIVKMRKMKRTLVLPTDSTEYTDIMWSANNMGKVFHGISGVPRAELSDEYKLIGNFYMSKNKGDDIEKVNKQRREILKSFFKSNTAVWLVRLSKLDYNAARSKLRGFFFHNLVVPPQDLRSRFNEKAANPLEVDYGVVVQRNQHLFALKNGASASSYAHAYSMLWNSVIQLVNGTKLKGGSRKVNKKPLIKYLSGKSGQIRGANLSKRMDYSGRSVIIVDPFMSMTDIGVPKEMLGDMLYLQARRLQNNSSNYNISNPYKKEVEDARTVGRREENAKLVCKDTRYTKQGYWWAQNGSEEDRERFNETTTETKMVIGRQPTLHKGSISSYNTIPVDDNAIHLSPLVCPAFNADFDGDTMWAAPPITKGAIHEAGTLLYMCNNLFWAKDGAPTITPRQEIIYGLNQCTTLEHSNAKNAKSIVFEDASANTIEGMCKLAYEYVVANKHRVYDKVVLPYSLSGGISAETTLGRLAFLHCLEDMDLREFSLDSYVVHEMVCPICGTREEITLHGTNNRLSGYKCKKHSNTNLVYLGKRTKKQCPCCSTVEDPVGTWLTTKDTNSDIGKIYSTVIPIDEDARRIETIVRSLHAIFEVNEALSTIHDDDIIEAIKQRYQLFESGVLISAEGQQVISARTPLDERNSIVIDNELSALTRAVNDLRPLIEHEDFIVLMQELGKNPKITFESLGISSAKGSVSATTNAPCSSIMIKYLTLMQSAHDKLRDANTSAEKMANQYISRITVCKCGFGNGSVTITNKNISFFIKKLLVASATAMSRDRSYLNNKLFVRNVNRMVKLGFSVAKFYAPTLNVLEDLGAGEGSPAYHINKFKEENRELIDFYNDGFLSEEEFNSTYAEEVKSISENMEKSISKTLSDSNNGFYKMIESGARGSKSNLVQMYGFKGQVRKSTNDAFSAIIEHSYINQLSPIEGFVAAYGSRRGIMDRSLETADTGYYSRQLWHGAQSEIIVSEDCGAVEEDAITLSISKIRSMINVESSTAASIFHYFINGRYGYINGSHEVTYINKALASECVQNNYTVKIHSPLTCHDHTCAKCYGIDMSTWNNVVVGTPVGIIAAEAIGETSAQLTMRTFQGGGSTKSGSISSAFDKLKLYVSAKFRKGPKSFIEKLGDSYEPVAQDTGDVFVDSNGNISIAGRVRLKNSSIDPSILKSFVHKGEGIFEKPGDRNPYEIWEVSGKTEAQLYMAIKMYDIFRSECNISLKHFEMLTKALTRALVLRAAPGSRLHEGCYYSAQELRRYMGKDESEPELSWEFMNVKTIPLVAPDALANIDFEHVAQGLRNAVMFDRLEDFSNPIEAIVFGYRPHTAHTAYAEEDLSKYIGDGQSAKRRLNEHYIYQRTGISDNPPSGVKVYNGPRSDTL